MLSSMAIKTRLTLFMLFIILFCITTSLAITNYESEQEDLQKEYQQCLQRCEQKQKSQEQQQCVQRCEQQRQEQEEKQESEYHGGRDPQQEYQQCQSRCQQEPQEEEQQQCQQRCEQQRQEQEERQKEEGESQSGDPQQEYQQCQSRCQQEPQEEEQQQCQQRCEQQRQEQEERQEEQGESKSRDPQQEYQQCQSRCQQEPKQQQCQQRCERQRQEQEQGGSESKEQQQESNTPYFLDEQSFEDRIRTKYGYTRVSKRFTKISNLLRGIENYRLGLFEADPSTFLIPHHLDADAVFVVVQGRGLINLVHQGDRQTYNLEGGDVIRVPAGALIYLINRDNNNLKFQIVSLFKPVSTPSNKFREFFSVGGVNTESFYNTFSDDILEAAFDTDKEDLDSLFRPHRRGEIVKVPQEHIKAISRGASSSQQGIPKWSKPGSQSWRPVNLLDQRPTQSNVYGELYDVTPNEYPQLQDLDVAVSYHNISKGAMVAPFYNSRATSLIIVVNGNNGRFEMACPHLSSSQSQREGRETREQEEKEGGSVHYQKVSARLSPRTAFIVPAGHPVSIVASDNQNLKIVAFKIGVENNQRIYLAGKNNVLNQLQKEAKELAFRRRAIQVETILNKQRQSVFLPGPNQRQPREQSEEGRHGGMLIETMADALAF